MSTNNFDSVFAIRDFTRTADSGAQTLVRLIIANPQKIAPGDFPAGTDWYSVAWQIGGLSATNAGGDPPVTNHASEDFDPLAAMLQALYSIRSLLKATPEGKMGKLKWNDIPEDPTWGLPGYITPTWAPAQDLSTVGGTGTDSP